MSQILTLTRSLEDQVDKINGRGPKKVEIIMEIDDGEKKGGMPTGTKRNKLMRKAKGCYIVYIDDDDEVPHYYVSEILKAVKSEPDCVGINGVMTTDGVKEEKWYISIGYEKWHQTEGEIKTYYRTPNHISPIKREIALKVPFRPITSGEDSDFSTRIFPLLKKEVLITKPMYHYKFKTKR